MIVRTPAELQGRQEGIQERPDPSQSLEPAKSKRKKPGKAARNPRNPNPPGLLPD